MKFLTICISTNIIFPSTIWDQHNLVRTSASCSVLSMIMFLDTKFHQIVEVGHLKNISGVFLSFSYLENFCCANGAALIFATSSATACHLYLILLFKFFFVIRCSSVLCGSTCVSLEKQDRWPFLIGNFSQLTIPKTVNWEDLQSGF